MPSSDRDLDADTVRQIEQICQGFTEAWRSGKRQRIEDCIDDQQEPRRSSLLRQLLRLEWSWCIEQGQTPDVERYCARFSDDQTLVRKTYDELFSENDSLRTVGSASTPHDSPKLSTAVDGNASPSSGSGDSTAFLQQIGRYQVSELLGKGGYGHVYLAYDDQLQRHVAIKVPNRGLVSRSDDAEAYLAEARTLASLDHPDIVPVYDVGSTDDIPCFVVSKYIEGSNLAEKIRADRPTHRQSAELVATVARALHHSHRKKLVHRDVKPDNILLDSTDKPYVADFGLALKEEDFGKRAGYTGTPAYMSPEQARGEGHLVDGRSDVFSLGVVLYELLTGQRPFVGDNWRELVARIVSAEARPPRQLNDRIPKELERICLKAMSKQAADRYTTAWDMAEDLNYFLNPPSGEQNDSDVSRSREPDGGVSLADVSPPQPAKIIPKGLRSFDAESAEFFLELLPGPRDRNGVPESIRFWKTRVEETDPEKTFRVGLIYGPSGCGKSSLVKAGLLPQLSGHVRPVYIEATPDDTEQRLFKALAKLGAVTASGKDLADVLANVRRARGGPFGKKVLIVLDQFEQWLHGHHGDGNAELLRALRHCDGARLQCVLMVRDGFYVAIHRFMRALQSEIRQGVNMTLVDLFQRSHALKVLAEFGRAYGRLPEKPEPLTDDQEAFLEQAIATLTEDDTVVSVHVAVFAEIMKNKRWTPSVLQDMGGAAGVGTVFLEENFDKQSASPAHLVQRSAAIKVLKSLLPDSGTEIKGHVRSEQELRRISGYDDRPEDFAELMQILDGELRIVTPSDVPDTATQTDQETQLKDRQPKYYQLTHDYLVPSLRQWLTRDQKSTWRGRALLTLEERTAEWRRGREARFLPGPWAYSRIQLAVPRSARTPDQQALMRAASRFHGLRAAIAAAFVSVAALGLIAFWRHSQQQQKNILVKAVLNADPDSVSQTIANLEPFGHLAISQLQGPVNDESVELQRRLHAAFALAALGRAPVDFLIDSIAGGPRGECRNMVQALLAASDSPVEELLRRASQEQNPQSKVRYATVSLHLGDSRPADRLLTLGPDPTNRTAFIHGFSLWHAELDNFPSLLRENETPSFRSGLCIALALVQPSDIAAALRAEIVSSSRDLYKHAPDGGTHSAAAWLLQRWREDLPSIPQTKSAPELRDWFINRQGMTMLKIPSGKFTMGDTLEKSNAVPHKVTLTRAVYFCDREVTVKQYLDFFHDPAYPAQFKPEGIQVEAIRSPTDDCPVQSVNWFEAVQFCNWLSWKEGRQPCYRSSNGAEGDAENWSCDFQSNGYRLPTEAEWEFACRARAATAYAFGDDVQLLPLYAICKLNSQERTWPAGTRIPNGWGLLDMHGNVAEWCWDWKVGYGPHAQQDPMGPESGGTPSVRVLRGGDWGREVDYARAGKRDSYNPRSHLRSTGLRVVCAED